MVTQFIFIRFPQFHYSFIMLVVELKHLNYASIMKGLKYLSNKNAFFYLLLLLSLLSEVSMLLWHEITRERLSLNMLHFNHPSCGVFSSYNLMPAGIVVIFDIFLQQDESKKLFFRMILYYDVLVVEKEKGA